jgi:hypothetical protein
MKTKFTLFFLVLGMFLLSSFSVSHMRKRTTKAVSIIEQRSFHLNGGNKATFAGGKSRTYLMIDLPQGTIEWYYSFSTSKDQRTSQNLGLALQITSLVANATAAVSSGGASLLAGGLSQSAISSIKVPSGSSEIDVYLCDRQNIEKFIQKEQFHYILEGTTMKTTQGLIRIKNIKSGTWFLGLRNPSMMYSRNITIEVVALVEE